MLSPAQIATGLVSIALVVVLFAAASGGGDAQPAPSVDDSVAAAGSADGFNDSVATIELVDGAPVGGVADLRVKAGERVRLVVRADAPGEVHVHGYDGSAKVSPSRPATFSFPADRKGAFEVELEGSGEQVAELTVRS